MEFIEEVSTFWIIEVDDPIVGYYTVEAAWSFKEAKKKASSYGIVDPKYIRIVETEAIRTFKPV